MDKILKILDKIEYDDSIEAQGCKNDCVTYSHIHSMVGHPLAVDGSAIIKLCYVCKEEEEYSASGWTFW